MKTSKYDSLQIDIHERSILRAIYCATRMIVKRGYILLLLLLFSGIGHGANIQIQVENRSVNGAVSVTLYDSVKTFKALSEPFINKVFDETKGDSYMMENVPPGSYALIMFIDENNNGKLDQNFVGIPTEPIGYANNYQPKGRPTFRSTTVVIETGKTLDVSAEFLAPLGERGQVGLGLGGVFSSSLYRDFSGDTVTPFPLVAYFGERLSIIGTELQIGLSSFKNINISALASYKLGAYEEKDSEFLAGMGDRKSVFMLGFKVQANLPLGLDLNASYTDDVTDKIGGGTAQLGLEKSFQIGDIEFTTGAGVNWLSSELSMYNFGVPEQNATLDRMAYNTDRARGFKVNGQGRD